MTTWQDANDLKASITAAETSLTKQKAEIIGFIDKCIGKIEQLERENENLRQRGAELGVWPAG